MKKKRTVQSAFLNLCVVIGLAVFFVGLLFALFAAANPQALTRERSRNAGEQVHRPNGVPVAPAGGVYEAWVARYNGPENGGNNANAIAVDGSSNVYLTGTSFGGSTENDYATIKYNSAGQEQWVTRYTGTPDYRYDEATAIAVDQSGNVYVTGYSESPLGDYDYATIKYNSAGQQQWVTRYNGPGNGSDVARAIAVDQSGNVYVTGISSAGGNEYEYATIKYNSFGQQQWAARYGGAGNGSDDEAYAIAVDGSGNAYVTGVSVGVGTGVNYATVKYNSAGQEQWVARYVGPANDDEAHAITVDGQGNVYVTGSSIGAGTGADYATVRYDSAGQQQWVARYNGPGNFTDRATAIVVDTSGDAYVTGYSTGSGTGFDYATIKYDSAGQQQWVARYNGPGNGGDQANAIALDGSSNVYVTGGSTGSGGTFDYATIKYDLGGQQQWVMRYVDPGTGYSIANAIAVDGSAHVYVTGYSDSDYATIKYVEGPTPTPTASPTPTATASPTPTPSFTPTPSATASPTITPTPSDFGGTPTATPTATPAATSTPSATPTPTATATPTLTPQATPSPTLIDTPTPTPTFTPTPRTTPIPRSRPSPAPRP